MAKQVLEFVAENPLSENTAEQFSRLDDEQVIKLSSVEKWLGLSRRTISRLREQNILPTVQVSPGRKGIKVADLRRYIASRSSDTGAKVIDLIRERAKSKRSRRPKK